MKVIVTNRKEQVMLQMRREGELVAEQDITTFTQREVQRLVTIQKEMGRTSNVKRIWIEEVME